MRGIPYVAFGGGEPLGVPHCWELFECLAAAGIGLKLETDARHIDAGAADRLAALPVQCIQISVDGACAGTHERVRPGSNFAAAIGAIERLVARGRAPQLVFVPTRLNLHEIVLAFDLAERLGCEAFVTGPLMRLGRAAAGWHSLACSAEDWARSAQALRERASGSRTNLAIYPWDILVEMERRLEESAGGAAGRAERIGEADECAAVRRRGSAPRYHPRGMGSVSTSVGITRSRRIRSCL